MSLSLTALALTGLLGAAAPDDPAEPPAAVPKLEEREDREFLEMLAVILAGGPVGPGMGWFHPAESRYGWEWLAAAHGVAAKGEITKERFRGRPELFARLDRDGNGVLRADDFDSPPPPPRPKAPPPGGPDRLTLLRGLFSGEIGSPAPGPKVGQAAPDFALRTPDGKREVKLSDFRGKKPVVLIFGSFT